MPTKISLLIDYASSPANLGVAEIHTGGWSETFWLNVNSNFGAYVAAVASRRALMLGATCRINGYRAQTYTISGNKLTPGGSSAAGLNLPGNSGVLVDLPQVSLSLVASSNGSANSRRFNLRGIPDSQMSGGEYDPSNIFSQYLSNYIAQLANGGAYFPGRDLSQVPVRVMSISLAGVMVTDFAIAGAAPGGFVRFLRVKTLSGLDVIGTYQITAVAGTSITLANWPAATVGQSGKVRLDLLQLFQINTIEVGRANVKKIGRPFQQYRGRRSRRPARV
jgi:hypothetical protein